jgi:hypothetical protein
VDPNLESHGVTSWTFIVTLYKRLSRYGNTSDLPNSVTVQNIPRSPSVIEANMSRIFAPRRIG